MANKPAVPVVVNPPPATTTTPPVVELSADQEIAQLRAELAATKQQLTNLSQSGITPEMEATFRECIRAGHTREDAILIARREQLGKLARQIKDPAEREAAIIAAAGAM